MIADLWRRIETWFETVAAYTNAFLPGVTPEELAEAEMVLGLTLPPDFKASYRIHNGAQTEFLLMGNLDFYPLSSGVSRWKVSQELSQQEPDWATRIPYWVEQQEQFPVQPVWWHPAWLDFVGNGAGDTWCIDLAPASGGHLGQVLSWSHEVSVSQVRFPSFEALLSTYADQLEAGFHVGRSPILPLEQLTHLKERREAFQQPSPTKSALHQAIRSAWKRNQDIEESPAAFRQVLQMPEASPEDRFFAYYGLICLYETEMAYLDDPTPLLFAQLEAEASRMPPTHWIHQEVALLRPWSIR